MSPSYTRDYPFVIARGEGAVVEDVDGNRFLDCAAGIAVNSTGVSHPEVVKAITEQAQKFIHMSGTDFYYEPQVRLAEELAAIVPIDGRRPDVLRATPGTEATEAAIKLARYHTKRQGIIAFLGAFHGRSLGSLSLTASKAIQRRGFGPFMPGVYHAPYPIRTAARQRRRVRRRSASSFIEDQLFVHLVSPDEVAAIVVEPIQGEGGYLVPPPAFLQGLRELTTKHGILLVVDEVQSGMGRTGKMFASEHIGVKPDIVDHREGHRVGPAAGRRVRAGRGHVVAAGRAREHVRRQSRRLRGRARDDRAAEGAAGRECRGGRRAPDERHARAAEEASRSSATSAARA